MPNRTTFLDRLIDRLDRLDPASVQTYVQKLVREKGFFETVFNTIHEGVVVVDQELRISYSNTAARRFLGLPEDADNLSLVRYIRDIDWRSLLDEDNSSWRGLGFHEVEIFYPRHRILNFYLVPHPVEGEDDRNRRATLIFQDVTNQRRLAEKAIESHRVEAVTQLAAGVAHEIGNPLNSLNIHLQLLGRHLDRLTDAGADQARQLLDVARHEVSRLDSITNEFLRAVRPVQPEFKPVRVQKLLAESLSFMRREIEDRGIRVEASLPERLPMVQGDAGQLKQVFYNILKNCIQAMSEGGLIDIDCAVTEEFLDVRFADNGRGIGSADMGRIMEPYFTTREGGGGLGLMIVERIVRAHNGEFSIESEEGHGTVVSVRLPLRERQARLLSAANRE